MTEQQQPEGKEQQPVGWIVGYDDDDNALVTLDRPRLVAEVQSKRGGWVRVNLFYKIHDPNESRAKERYIIGSITPRERDWPIIAGTIAGGGGEVVEALEEGADD